jgi:hypothetical protein
MNQRGALFHPRSGSASDRRLQPSDYFFKDDCSCLAALRSPINPTGPGNPPVLRWETRFGGSSSWVWSFFDSSTPRSTGPLTLRRLPRELDSSPSRLTRFGASLRGRSRLVPVRVRVVVPHFPSPESLSPSFGNPSLRELPPSARRSSSEVPKVLGVRPPAASCQFLQCSRPTGKPRGSSAPSLPYGSSGITRPEGPVTVRSFSSRPVLPRDFRAPVRRPQPFRRRRDGPRLDHSWAPFVRPGLPRGQRSPSLSSGSRAPLLSLPRRGPPSSGRVPSTTAASGDFHGLRSVPPLALLEIASGGRRLFFPAWAGTQF